MSRRRSFSPWHLLALVAASLAAAPLAPAAPPNDDFADAQVLEGLSGQASGTNVDATREDGEPFIDGNSGGSSVWWRWTAPRTEDVIVQTFGSDFDTLLGVYTGDAVGALTLVGENDDAGDDLQSLVSFGAVAFTEYRFAVDGFGGESGNVLLNWLSGGPANDLFADAAPLAGPSGRTTTTSLGATREDGEPFIDGNPGGHSVWWRWTSPRTEFVTIHTFGSSFDTLLGVYTGDAVGALALIGENDDAGDDLQSLVSFGAVAGTEYRLAVDGFDGENGNIILTWFQEKGAPAANDDFAARARIEGVLGFVLASNEGATREAGEPDHVQAGGSGSLWWSWTAPGDGTVDLTTLGSTFDTLLAVYTGAAVDALTLVAENDDGEFAPDLSSMVSFPVTAGTELQIAVDGFGGSTGLITLSWSFTGGGGKGGFLRGDIDDDIDINLTDAVTLLSYLFLGGRDPLCADAADVNDDSDHNLTDAVFLLNALFLAGPEPPPPGFTCGTDPTEDAFGPCGGAGC